MNKKKIIVVSGYFNPIHKGHIEYINKAKALGDILIMIVNNDFQRELKGSIFYQDEDERVLILSHIREVDEVILSIDSDETVCSTLKMIANRYNNDFVELVFVNGGDQNNETIKEQETCVELGIRMTYGLGEKIQSSSLLLKNKKENKGDRPAIIKGEVFEDQRGWIYCNNNISLSSTRRLYEIENINQTLRRGWKGHIIESRWFYCTEGSIKIKVRSIINGKHLSDNTYDYTLSSKSGDILHVPPNFATLIQQETVNSRLLCFSDYSFGEKEEDLRFKVDNNE